MKKIINGKLYNTETATCVGFGQYSEPKDYEYWREELYRKKNGEYFLYGEGGPYSRYSRTVGLAEWSSGKTIRLMDVSEAKKWAEMYLDGEAYIAEFGEPEE